MNIEPSRMRVPRPHQAAFAAVANLSEEDAQRLLAALSDLPGPLTRESLLRQMRDVMSPDDDAVTLLDALISLEMLRTARQWEPEAAARALADSLEGDLGANRDVLVSRLDALLDSRALRLVSKALDLGGSYERVLVSSRIASDIRPVFGDDAESLPEAGLVSHALRLDYYRKGEIESIYFALDVDDLRLLGEQVGRALDKETSLDRMLEQSGFRRIDLTGTDD